jgi:hypothetical protein
MAQPVHKPGPAGEQTEVDGQWTLEVLSVEILRTLIERRLAESESYEFAGACAGRRRVKDR